jgi:hypothetical protein
MKCSDKEFMRFSIGLFLFTSLIILFLSVLTSCTEDVKSVEYRGAWDYKHSYGRDWTRLSVDRLWNANTKYLLGMGFLEKNPDKMNEFADDFGSKSIQGKIQIYNSILSCLARYESNYKPETKYTESFKEKDEPNSPYVVSTGIMQVSKLSCQGYKTPIKIGHQLHGAFENLDCASRIIAKWVNTDNALYGFNTCEKTVNGKKVKYACKPFKGMSRYWSPFRKQSRIDSIKKCVRDLNKSVDENVITPEPDPVKEPEKDLETFNEYVLKAVKYIDDNFRLLGYGSAWLTHDVPYANNGVIPRYKGDDTHCVGAQLEILLEAMNIYYKETGKLNAHTFLPKKSWTGWNKDAIRAHIWVKSELNSYGTSDALRNFGMGKSRVSFSDLKPGSFCNYDRTNRTGHATTFISFIDIDGNELSEYSDKVKGFKYYSSQSGGMDYRYAYFSGTCPTLESWKKRDCGIKKSSLICGYAFHPSKWKPKSRTARRSLIDIGIGPENFDIQTFNGVTTD